MYPPKYQVPPSPPGTLPWNKTIFWQKGSLLFYFFPSYQTLLWGEGRIMRKGILTLMRYPSWQNSKNQIRFQGMYILRCVYYKGTQRLRNFFQKNWISQIKFRLNMLPWLIRAYLEAFWGIIFGSLSIFITKKKLKNSRFL